MQYQRIISKLKAIADRAELTGDDNLIKTVDKVEKDLQSWLDSVAAEEGDECPVDLGPVLQEPEMKEYMPAAPVQLEAQEPAGESDQGSVRFENAAPAETVVPAPGETAEPPAGGEPGIPVEIAPEDTRVPVQREEEPVATQFEQQPTRESAVLSNNGTPGGEPGEEIFPVLLSTLLRELDQARNDFANKDYRPVINRCARVARELPENSPNREAALQLQEQARSALAAAIKELLDRGDQARVDGNLTSARDAYLQARNLDPDNSEIKQRLLMLDELEQSGKEQETIEEKKRDLRQRRDLQRLGDAIWWAEDQHARSLLSSELKGLLDDAQAWYEAQRRRMGELTTLMRYGDLEARKNAFDAIRNIVSEAKVNQVFDETTGRFRDPIDLMNEASQHWEEGSKDTAQHDLDRANQALPAYPYFALERIQTALNKPFYDVQRRLLEQKLAEIEVLIKKDTEAKKILVEAEKETDDILRLRKVLQAYDVFPELPGLAAQLEQTRNTTLANLLARMESRIANAEENLKQARQAEPEAQAQIFAESEALLQEAALFPAQWPEAKRPEPFQRLLAEIERVRSLATSTKNELREFEQMISAVRRQVADPNNRQAGLQLFTHLKQDPRFKDLARLRILDNEFDQYKDIGEQLTELRLLRNERPVDWLRIVELANTILKSGKTGQFSEEVNGLFAEANLERQIEVAQTHLSNGEVREANMILSALLLKSMAKEAFQERLKAEFTQISEAIDYNPKIQPLFDEAILLAADATRPLQQVQALQRFRYIGGDITEPQQKDWPKYSLSLCTAEARIKARELGEKLVQIYLDKIRAASKIAAKGGKPELYNLGALAEGGRALREGRLLALRTDEEREAVRWVETTWCEQQVEEKQSIGDWDSVVALLEGLLAGYTQVADLEPRLRRARIAQALAKANQLRKSERIDEAIQLLNGALEKKELVQSWELVLGLAEAYVDQAVAFYKDGMEEEGDHSFDLAFAQLQLAEIYPAAGSALAARRIQFGAIRNDINGREDEALRSLQEAIEKSPQDETVELRRLQTQIFTAHQGELLSTASRTMTDEEKIKAVFALLELKRLEDLCKIPEENRRSTTQFKTLLDKLSSLIEAMIKAANDFEPSLILLKDAISQAGQLVSRLDTFGKIGDIPLSADMGERLASQRSRIAKLLPNLENLQRTLAEVDTQAEWMKALTSENFEAMDKTSQKISLYGLDDMGEVKAFNQKLQEWKDMHTFLSGKLQEINRLFTREENFGQVVLTVRALRNRPNPSARPENNRNKPWIHIQENEYKPIHECMGSKLIITDIYGDQTINGWEEMEKAAQERDLELSCWEQWKIGWERLMDNADSALQEAHSPQYQALGLGGKVAAWEAVQQKSASAIAALQIPPEMKYVQNGEERYLPVPIRSNKAWSYNQEAKKAAQVADQWRHQATVELNRLQGNVDSLGGFPTGEAFKRVVDQKDLNGLDLLVQRAELIGPSSAEEEKRLKFYKKYLEGQRGVKKPSGWKPFWKKNS